MEIKKSAGVDLNKKSPFWLLLGINLSLLMVLGAFHLKNMPKKNVKTVDQAEIKTIDDEVIVIKNDLPPPPPPPPDMPPPPPPPVMPPVVNPVEKEPPKKEKIPTVDPTPAPPPQLVSSEAARSAPPSPPPSAPAAVPVEEKIETIDYAKVHQKPTFAECQKFTGKQADDCFLSVLRGEIQKNLEFPDDNEIAGTVFVRFIIDESGKLVEIKAIAGPDKRLNRAAEQSVERVNRTSRKKIIPGQQPSGNKVRVPYKIPIRFQLAE